ncbi:PBP1A family penicillin-binding protein [Barrientosiimonas marina]|uniref:Transglycosylase domain-containing protein n=1 Tax=Lentibacillus kimchii TaxID=1542911 RepID=A0ABW2UXR1_9BACI
MKTLFHKLKKKHRLFYLLPIGFLALGVMFLASVYAVSFLMGAPKLANEQNTVYYSLDDTVIGEETGSENRHWVALDQMSPHLIEATLAVEDQHFYDHHGFDFKRIASAIMTDLKNLSLEEGASTLTQQYARNLFLSHQKTWWRKVKEAFYTIRLEMFYTKDELLEGYLNTIYYGHGAYGAEAASQHIFNKSASDLTVAESAMMAGIPKGPAYYSPFNNRQNAKDRQEHILDSMLAQGNITEQEQSQAARENLAFTEPGERETVSAAPYFQDTALNEAAEILDMDPEDVRSSGLAIHTTLDTRLQSQLKQSSQQEIQPGSDIEIGAMTINPDTGGIRALIGGRNYTKSPFNRATHAKRMAGSAFKPFLYYAALNHGYTPSTTLMSKPTSFKLENGEVYQPSNYNGYYADEPIPLAQALALSDNVYAVKTNLYLGTDQLVKTARQFGISGKLREVPSLALGTAAVTVDDMVTGYGMLANGGHELESHAIRKIVDRDGRTIYKREDGKQDPVLDPQTTFVLTQLMTGMFDRSLDGYMSVTGSSIADRLSRTYAGKSGTTESDSWMLGYSPSLVTGIWIGYDDNRAITRTAENAYAKEIWASFMEEAHTGDTAEAFAKPEDVVGIAIDPETGKRTTPYCDTSRTMYFKAGNAPEEYCQIHMPDDQKQHNGDAAEDTDEPGLWKRLWDRLF